GVGRTDLGAVHLFARAGLVVLRVDAAKRGVGLEVGIEVDAGAAAGAFLGQHDARSSGRPARRRGVAGEAELAAVVHVMDSLGVGAAVALELRLDPVDGGAIAVGALATVAESGEAEDSVLVVLEVEAADERDDAGVERLGGRGSWSWCGRRSSRDRGWS